MKWIEVIEFRSYYKDRELSKLDFWNSIKNISEEEHLVKFEVYDHCTLSTDSRIQLSYESPVLRSQGSPLGLRLVSELKAIGAVNHTIWVEVNNLEHAPKEIERKEP